MAEHWWCVSCMRRVEVSLSRIAINEPDYRILERHFVTAPTGKDAENMIRLGFSFTDPLNDWKFEAHGPLDNWKGPTHD
jgi:hypothetical protein